MSATQAAANPVRYTMAKNKSRGTSHHGRGFFTFSICRSIMADVICFGSFILDVKLLSVYVATLVQGDAVDSPFVAVQDLSLIHI